jgi:hypothetical protein
MTREDKVKTLKLHLAGLYGSEAEIAAFLDSYPRGLSFDCLRFYGLNKFYYQQKKYKNKQAGLVLKKVRKIQSDFLQGKGFGETGSDVKYLLRIDDFPHWNIDLDTFRRFLEILQKDEIPCLLGVTPFLSADRHNPENQNFRDLTAEEISILSSPLVEIALHGFTHQARQAKFHIEFI